MRDRLMIVLDLDQKSSGLFLTGIKKPAVPVFFEQDKRFTT